MDNMAICMNPETGQVSKVEVLDHGGSIRYAGTIHCVVTHFLKCQSSALLAVPRMSLDCQQSACGIAGWRAKQPWMQCICHYAHLWPAGAYCRAPEGFTHNVLTASPEVARARAGDYFNHIDGCAHDCWGVGCIALRAFIDRWPFRCEPTGNKQQDYANVADSHTDWVRAALLYSPAAYMHRQWTCELHI